MGKFKEASLKAFRGAVGQIVISGPATLYRFSGHPKGIGEWWISEDVFMMIYNESRDQTYAAGPNTSKAGFRRLYRKYLSVSLDWNDLENFFRMDIPAGASATGWRGDVKDQSIVSDDGQAEYEIKISGRLPGGVEQLFLEQYDLAWIRRVSF
ncbi:hypothetical protein [Mesorhizobium sp. CN2-181]|uniref:hypothetical protein n=1 Tax=Mesorhizobium yinganensis TaxID=3157707 RepID=UPI0032B72DE9